MGLTYKRKDEAIQFFSFSNYKVLYVVLRYCTTVHTMYCTVCVIL